MYSAQEMARVDAISLLHCMMVYFSQTCSLMSTRASPDEAEMVMAEAINGSKVRDKIFTKVQLVASCENATLWSVPTKRPRCPPLVRIDYFRLTVLLTHAFVSTQHQATLNTATMTFHTASRFLTSEKAREDHTNIPVHNGPPNRPERR
jgi:hypothetical protein